MSIFNVGINLIRDSGIGLKVTTMFNQHVVRAIGDFMFFLKNEQTNHLSITLLKIKKIEVFSGFI